MSLNGPITSRLARLRSTDSENAGDVIDVERLLSMGLRQIKVVGVCALIGLLFGIIYLQTTPPTFMSTSSVMVDNGIGKSFDPISPAAASMETDADILSQIEIIRSERLARVVNDKLRLDQNDAFLSPPSSLLSRIVGNGLGFVRWLSGGSSGQAPAQEVDPAAMEAMILKARQEQAVSVLQNGIIAGRAGRANVVSLGFEDFDPVLAQQVASAYTNAYLADQLDATFDSTERAVVWLQERLINLQQNSQAAARAVEDFRAKHGLTEAKGELISEQRLSDLNTQLVLAQADTAKALARFEQYKAMAEGGADAAAQNVSVSTEVTGDSVIAKLRAKFLEVTRRENEVTANFGADHPQAVALKAERLKISEQILGELKQLAQSYGNDYQVALSRETTLRKSVDQSSGDNSDSRQFQVELRELQVKADALNQLYQTFLSRHEEAMQQQSFPIAKVRILSEAGRSVKVSPRTTIALAMCLLLGLIIGGGLGALNEFNERFFRTADDVRDRLGAKFLGYLPFVDNPDKARDDQVLRTVAASERGTIYQFNHVFARFAHAWKHRRTKLEAYFHKKSEAELTEEISDEARAVRARMRTAVTNPTSPFAETLRNMKIASDLLLHNRPCKVIGIVSMLPNEGKSTVAANFARLLAFGGANVLLVDCDLRKPGLSRGLGMSRNKGLIDAIVNKQSWREVAKHSADSRLTVVPSGARGRSTLAHTSELLSSQSMRRFMEDAKSSFEYIVVDLPPLGPVVDAKASAPMIDGFIVVIKWGATPRAVVRTQLQSEPEIAEKVMGVVLNQVDFKSIGRFAEFGGTERFLDTYASYYADPEKPRIAKVKAPVA